MTGEGEIWAGSGEMVGEAEPDLFCGVPCDALHVLGVLHEDAHAFEVIVGMCYGDSSSEEPNGENMRCAPSQIHTVLSLLQLARRFPEAEYATLLHSVSCPSSRLMHSHSPVGLDASPSFSSSASCAQMPILESKDAVASALPEGDQATARTVFACPVGIVVRCENFRDEPPDSGEVL